MYGSPKEHNKKTLISNTNLIENPYPIPHMQTTHKSIYLPPFEMYNRFHVRLKGTRVMESE